MIEQIKKGHDPFQDEEYLQQRNINQNQEFEGVLDDEEQKNVPPKVLQTPIIKCLLNIHPKSLYFENNNVNLKKQKRILSINCFFFFLQRMIGEWDLFLIVKKNLKLKSFTAQMKLWKERN